MVQSRAMQSQYCEMPLIKSNLNIKILTLPKGQDSRAAGSSTGKSAQLETDEMIDKELARLMTLRANTDSDSESDFESELDVFKNCQRDDYRGPSCAAESQANLLSTVFRALIH